MLDRSETRLAVIENFRPDRQLPKYQNRNEKREQSKNIYISDNSDDVEFIEDFGKFESSGGRSIFFKTKPGKLGFWARFFAWFKRAPKSKPPTMTIIEFFTQIKTHAQKIEIIEERAKGYEVAMLNAKKSGQVALMEKLKDGLGAYLAETRMLSIGIEKFVTEDTVVEFYKKCKKGLRLDYVANFVRTIPPDLIELKQKADELEIFDNYAVLHYDPDAKSYSETKAEKAARKDPILFGLLKGRTDLYVLGDWIDEVCDLTLDQMADVLGRDAANQIPEISSK